MNRGSWGVLGTAAVLGLIWACDGDTRTPGGSGADAGSGGSDSNGDTGGTSGAGAPSDLDAGVGGGVPGSDASVSDGITARRFCGFDGARFTTYEFPSGESVQSFGVEPLRVLSSPVSVDSARDEVFVQSCGVQGACSVAVFAAESAGFARPLRTIELPTTNTRLIDTGFDASNDALILMVQERGNYPTRVLTIARDASDLSAPIREFEVPRGFLSFVLDAERGELYLDVGSGMSVYARDASGNPEPLRTLEAPQFNPPRFSPARGEYHVQSGATLETYALPAPAAPEALPLRTLTLPNASDGINFVDEVNGELWSGSSVFDLTASGQAVSLRSQPTRRPVGLLAERDEVVFQRDRGDLEFYSRTAEGGPPLRVIEAVGDATQRLLAIDVQRDEVFFIGGDGTISVYARDATGEPAPLRRLRTELRPGNALLDAESALLIGDTRSIADGMLQREWVSYPASAGGQGQPSQLFIRRDDDAPYEFSSVVLDREHGQLLGVIGAQDFQVPRYGAYSATGDSQAPYPVAPIVSWRGPPVVDYGEGWIVRVNALAYDSERDEVVLAVRDCFAEIEEGLEVDFTTYYDCYYDLRSYPRTGGSAYTTIELPEEVHALAYDAQNDMLMLSGEASVMFVDRAQQRGDAADSDAGVAPNAGSHGTLVPTYQFPLAGSFQYCD